MNKDDDFVTTTLRMTIGDRAKLAKWARANLTNMAAEVARAIRERAQREAETAEVA